MVFWFIVVVVFDGFESHIQAGMLRPSREARLPSRSIIPTQAKGRAGAGALSVRLSADGHVISIRSAKTNLNPRL